MVELSNARGDRRTPSPERVICDLTSRYDISEKLPEDLKGRMGWFHREHPAFVEFREQFYNTIQAHKAELLALGVRVPLLGMVVAEILKNSLLHGIVEQPTTDPGWIQFRMHCTSSRLSLSIKDSGVFEEKTLAQVWKRAGRAPTVEELEKDTGRGFLLIRDLLPEMHFDETNRVLTFSAPLTVKTKQP